MTTLSNEQFERLLQAVNQSNQRLGSFSSCAARFNGERSSTKVEEFLAAILTFKAVEKISDADAISGMPMVLEGDAAEWWQGVKSKAEVFTDVVRMLREAFSPPKPSWRVYVEIFETKQQKNEPTDSFIRRKRALFSQLANMPAEADQIDILFGLLNIQIRERISRERFSDFDGLLKEAREAELSLQERKIQIVNAEPERGSGPVRCGFCRKKGHSVETCFKKKNDEARESHGAMLSQAQALKPKFACYGCNAPGVTRANCPNCIKKPAANPSAVSFNSLNSSIGREIPIANIQMFGVPGQAYFDTGARTSVASANLKRVMDFKGCVFRSVRCEITLADGNTSFQRCLSTTCKILIGGRSHDIQFIVLPNAENNRTLLGADFMEKAGIVMNMGQRYWYYESEPSQQFDFVEPLPLELNLVETVKVSVPSNKRKPVDEVEGETDQSKIYMSEFEYYGPDIPINYSPHSIQSIFKDSLPANATTPERSYGGGLFDGVHKKQSADLFSIDFKFLKETDGVELAESEKAQLQFTLKGVCNSFCASTEPTPHAEHFIDTGSHEPIAQTTGYSAAYLTFGRELRTFDDIQRDVRAIIESENFIPQITPYLKNMVESFKNARETEQKMQDRNKNYVDKQRRPQDGIAVGAEVLVTTHVLSQASKGVTSKFVPKRDGPYVVTRKIGASTFEVASRSELNVPLGAYHASALTLYRGTNANEPPAPVQPIRKRGRPRKSRLPADVRFVHSSSVKGKTVA